MIAFLPLASLAALLEALRNVLIALPKTNMAPADNTLSGATVDERNPKQPPAIFKTLEIIG